MELIDGTNYEIGIPRQYSNGEMNSLITYMGSKIGESDARTKRKPVGNDLDKSKNKQETNNSKDEILHTLRLMNPVEFEKVVANIWESQGWNVQLTPQSSDRGVDIIATKEETFESRRYLIQAKKYGKNNKVNSEEIQRYAGLYARDEQVDSVFVVTSSSFTSEAKRVAENRNVEIINSTKLIELICKQNIEI